MGFLVKNASKIRIIVIVIFIAIIDMIGDNIYSPYYYIPLTILFVTIHFWLIGIRNKNQALSIKAFRVNMILNIILFILCIIGVYIFNLKNHWVNNPFIVLSYIFIIVIIAIYIYHRESKNNEVS
ncbi:MULTISPECIES: hypothetical protein [Mammaliicoccus]|jgi:4-hydroxybenzoate polyprenyltransferase|uniref:hypothetical protein n=1 Tax=Mammaliicoccus TaxID=2803850 RepID=UPI0011CC613C|nr:MULTISPECIES: hypothetical protein [Mammaliicoccus]WHI54505.1 hypothetical protein PYH59_11765 [Mammaliicoccus lentus]WHI57027.1 hypothetical protein PYH49_11430 [Mammaliicoccus lentus]WHI64873.1 hypothetical protein PYH50_11435 [Mammaliicoccus lentus]WHI85765.1 hypothetical protein PYH60_11440 [Mammaliicoccus lentus]WHI90274.1 hypothetical protein PYH61_11435 [Mammaliicoccus lentus]